jgi:hypothetical protein
MVGLMGHNNWKAICLSYRKRNETSDKFNKLLRIKNPLKLDLFETKSNVKLL